MYANLGCTYFLSEDNTPIAVIIITLHNIQESQKFFPETRQLKFEGLKRSN
jgi:hypothetical protein